MSTKFFLNTCDKTAAQAQPLSCVRVGALAVRSAGVDGEHARPQTSGSTISPTAAGDSDIVHDLWRAGPITILNSVKITEAREATFEAGMWSDGS
ncbi:hypothetical protein EVAR_9806_1 [Eumeta japonica]|uniref:Uncharacterized protein n=1 Tax=Eumeta variegata TaxID=151549 RepID=A0A4C1U5M0_EUMVA|nr:hypothetical protein EVAR_9806_1 [Eumeta japonica]